MKIKHEPVHLKGSDGLVIMNGVSSSMLSDGKNSSE